jgi:hypothetical protein
MDYPFGEPSNCPEIPDSSSEPLLLGDAVELQSNNVWRGTKGILTNWCSVKKAFWFESLDPSRKAISGWMKEQWDDEEAGICRLVKIDHPNDSPKPDSSSEPMREAFEDWMAPNYDWNQGYFGRNENRYFDSSVEMAWQAFQAGSKYQPSPLAPSPCMDGVNVDQFVDGVMEARGRASGLQVGDAVRFVSPGHNRHGTEGILKSIHHGPKNAYLFVSDCGQFHRYCTIAELERADQADPIDIKGSMQSLDGADTIQAGDLQWTDRDGKYRLCNFTLGMRVHEAIQRGKAHGEKWVFYRKFREVGE